EIRNPRRTIPLMYWGSFAVVVLLYLSLAFTAIGAAASGEAVTGASGLAALVGTGVTGELLGAGVGVGVGGDAHGWVFGASRLVFSAGRDGILPAGLAKVSNGVPWVSLVALFGAYAAVILGTQVWGVTVSALIPLVSQNFLVLYAFSILAFW